MRAKGYSEEHTKLWMDSVKSKKHRVIYTKAIYKVPAGTYEAETLIGLIWEVFKHRCWHLWKHKRWMD